MTTPIHDGDGTSGQQQPDQPVLRSLEEWNPAEAAPGTSAPSSFGAAPEVRSGNPADPLAAPYRSMVEGALDGPETGARSGPPSVASEDSMAITPAPLPPPEPESTSRESRRGSAEITPSDLESGKGVTATQPSLLRMIVMDESIGHRVTNAAGAALMMTGRRTLVPPVVATGGVVEVSSDLIHLGIRPLVEEYDKSMRGEPVDWARAATASGDLLMLAAIPVTTAFSSTSVARSLSTPETVALKAARFELSGVFAGIAAAGGFVGAGAEVAKSLRDVPAGVSPLQKLKAVVTNKEAAIRLGYAVALVTEAVGRRNFSPVTITAAAAVTAGVDAANSNLPPQVGNLLNGRPVDWVKMAEGGANVGLRVVAAAAPSVLLSHLQKISEAIATIPRSDVRASTLVSAAQITAGVASFGLLALIKRREYQAAQRLREQPLELSSAPAWDRACAVAKSTSPGGELVSTVTAGRGSGDMAAAARMSSSTAVPKKR